jgi:hypothetical protein
MSTEMFIRPVTIKYMKPEVGNQYVDATFQETGMIGGIYVKFGQIYDGFISTNDLNLKKTEKSKFTETKVLPERLKNYNFMVEVIRADPGTYLYHLKIKV